MTDGGRDEGDELDRRIAAAKQAHAPHAISHGEGAAENKGWAVGIEFVGTVLVSAFIGWLIDKWIHTAPWVMILFLVLGFVAGLRRAMVTSGQIDNSSNSKHGH